MVKKFPWIGRKYKHSWNAAQPFGLLDWKYLLNKRKSLPAWWGIRVAVSTKEWITVLLWWRFFIPFLACTWSSVSITKWAHTVPQLKSTIASCVNYYHQWATGIHVIRQTTGRVLYDFMFSISSSGISSLIMHTIPENDCDNKAGKFREHSWTLKAVLHRKWEGKGMAWILVWDWTFSELAYTFPKG